MSHELGPKPSAEKPNNRERIKNAAEKVIPQDLKEGVGIIVKGKTAEGDSVSRRARLAQAAKVTTEYGVPGTLAILSGPLGVAAGVGAMEIKNYADRRVKKETKPQD